MFGGEHAQFSDHICMYSRPGALLKSKSIHCASTKSLACRFVTWRVHRKKTAEAIKIDLQAA